MANPLDRVRTTPPPVSSQRGARGQIDPRVQQAITTVAAQYNVDPALAIALLRQENAGQNPRLVGTSGEVGLFQILPITALTYVQAPGNTRQERVVNMTEQLKNPNFNTQIAMQHLKRLGDMFQHDPEKIFAAYNAGPTTVKRAEQDALARGITWQQSIQENRASRGVRPKQVQDYTSSAGGLLQEGGGLGAPVSSTGVQRDILRAVPPDVAPTTVPPGIPGPRPIPRMGLTPGAPPPVAETPATPVPAGVPPPPVRPQPPQGPPTPPERTPVSPAPPPGTGPVVNTPTGPQPSWSSSAPTTPPPARPTPAPSPPVDTPVLDTDMMSGAPAAPTPAPTTPAPPPTPPPLSLASVPILDRDIMSGAPMPVPPSRGTTSDFGQPANPPILDRDMLTGMPLSGPPTSGATSEWEPSLATVPQDIKTPGVAPQADMNAALGSLTDEELLDLAQWLQERGAGAPVGAPTPEPFPQPYHQNIAGGLPTMRPKRPQFAEEAAYPWEGGR